MSSCPTPRAVKILEGVRADLECHGSRCGDRVIAIALNPLDHRELCIAEIWGLPVLAWSEVELGRYRLVCEANGVLIPQINTVDELLDRWAYQLDRSVPVKTS